MKYNFLVFLGRFQPFHNEHKDNVEKALLLSEKVIIGIGSSNIARSPKNPWTFDERKKMILESFNKAKRERLIVIGIPDLMYQNEQWCSDTQKLVHQAVLQNIEGNTAHNYLSGFQDQKLGIIGCLKDNSSFYLKLFPQWKLEELPYKNNLDATVIRKKFFESKWFKDDVPRGTFNVLDQMDLTVFEFIKDEIQSYQKYKDIWSSAPYPPTFVTVDSCVIQSGHILLVKRKFTPGKGLYALPGGFLNQDETIETAMIRELREETGLKVPEQVLIGSITKSMVFDDPNRSLRGRTITHAYLIHLKTGFDLPHVRGQDDAEKAFWMPLSEFHMNENLFFEDHQFIIRKLIADL